MRTLAAKLIVVATAVCAVVVAAIYAGALTFLASDADVSTDAFASIAAYWGLFTLVVLAVTGMVNRPRELLLALVSAGLFLGVAEVAVRVLDVDAAKTPYAGLSSSAFHHVNAANAEMFMGKSDGYPVVIRTNDDGLRCDMSRDEVRAHENRVLVMGDSYVWGMGVRQEKMLTEVMQQNLRDRLRRDRLRRDRLGRDPVAVVAGAAISYSPFLLRQLYRSVFSTYRPTVVILVLDASDIGDDVMYARENLGTADTLRFDLPDESPKRFYCAVHRVAEPFLDAVGRALAYPYNTFFRPGRSSYDYYNFDLVVGGTAERNRYFIYRHPLDETRPFFDATLSIIDDIARDVENDGAHFLLAVAPRYHHWSDRECPGNWEVRQYQYTGREEHEFAYIRYFEEAAPRLDYDVLDLLPAFQSTDRFPLVLEEDPHWNEAGHQFVAGLLCDYLAERGWVK